MSVPHASLLKGGVFEGQRRLYGDFFSGPGVQVHAHEIRSFWQVGLVSNRPPTLAEKLKW